MPEEPFCCAYICILLREMISTRHRCGSNKEAHHLALLCWSEKSTETISLGFFGGAFKSPCDRVFRPSHRLHRRALPSSASAVFAARRGKWLSHGFAGFRRGAPGLCLVLFERSNVSSSGCTSSVLMGMNSRRCPSSKKVKEQKL